MSLRLSKVNLPVFWHSDAPMTPSTWIVSICGKPSKSAVGVELGSEASSSSSLLWSPVQFSILWSDVLNSLPLSCVSRLTLSIPLLLLLHLRDSKAVILVIFKHFHYVCSESLSNKKRSKTYTSSLLHEATVTETLLNHRTLLCTSTPKPSLG